MQWTSRARSLSCLGILMLLVGLAVVARPADAASGEFSVRLDAREAALRDAVNAERGRNGLAPLAVDARLQRAARRHVADMTRFGYFGHGWHNGTPFGTWLARYTRCVTASEILAWRSPQETPGAAVRQWLSSPVHRAALLADTWGVMGVELTQRHAAVEFGRRC